MNDNNTVGLVKTIERDFSNQEITMMLIGTLLAVFDNDYERVGSYLRRNKENNMKTDQEGSLN